MILNYPGGAGGNWLKTILDGEPTHTNTGINFHKHTVPSDIELIHSLEPKDFDYLYSGSYYFNFYVNLLYKFYLSEINYFCHNNYKNYYTKCINAAKFICQFDNIKNLVFFNFDDLIVNDEKFYKNILEVRPTINISYSEFANRKNRFFDTFVDTSDLYENFDNQFWVTFVLGQLMNINIYPVDFSVYVPETQSLSSKFALDNYKFCKLKSVHHFKTGVQMPDVLKQSLIVL